MISFKDVAFVLSSCVLVSCNAENQESATTDIPKMNKSADPASEENQGLSLEGTTEVITIYGECSTYKIFSRKKNQDPNDSCTETCNILKQTYQYGYCQQTLSCTDNANCSSLTPANYFSISDTSTERDTFDPTIKGD